MSSCSQGLILHRCGHPGCLSPSSTRPVVTSGAVVPVALDPGMACPWPPPMSIMPYIGPAGPYPIPVDPDIAVSGCSRLRIDHIGGLIGDITVDRTADKTETAGYSND